MILTAFFHTQAVSSLADLKHGNPPQISSLRKFNKFTLYFFLFCLCVCLWPSYAPVFSPSVSYSHFSKKREFFLLTVARFFLTGDHLDSRFDTCMVFTFSYNTPRYVFWSVSRISDFNFQCFEKITADNQNFCLVLHIKIFLAPVKLKLFKAISSAFSYGLEGEFVKVPENPSLV